MAKITRLLYLHGNGVAGGDGQGRGLLHSGRITNSRRLLLSLLPRHSACLISEMRSSIPRRIIKAVSITHLSSSVASAAAIAWKWRSCIAKTINLVVMYSRSNFLSPKLKTFGFTATFRHDAPDLLTVTWSKKQRMFQLVTLAQLKGLAKQELLETKNL